MTDPDKKYTCGIYCILNPINNKRYIGQSTKIQKRFYHHKRDLSKGRHSNRYLQRAFDKLQISKINFSYYILEECTVDDLDLCEIKWIQHYNTCERAYGYNIRSGGAENHILDPETIKIMSERMMGKLVGEKNPMYGVTSPFKGKHHSNEAKEHRRKKMREWGILHPDANRGENNAFYGHHHTEASKSRMSEVRKEYYKTHESYRLRPVVCLNDDVTILSRYDSVGSAALAVNRSNATISGACSGRQHTCIGYKWMYESDYLEMIGGNASNAS